MNGASTVHLCSNYCQIAALAPETCCTNKVECLKAGLSKPKALDTFYCEHIYGIMNIGNVQKIKRAEKMKFNTMGEVVHGWHYKGVRIQHNIALTFPYIRDV